jgi:hypothetical protein
VGALGQGFAYAPPAQAVLAHRRRSGSGPLQQATGCLAFVSQCSDQHARAKHLDPLAPQPRPRRDSAVLDSDRITVGSNDPRGDITGTGALGLAAGPGVGGMISPNPPIALREGVVAVGAQRRAISPGAPRPARVAHASWWQPATHAVGCPLLLACRQPVLVGVVVAP